MKAFLDEVKKLSRLTGDLKTTVRGVMCAQALGEHLVAKDFESFFGVYGKLALGETKEEAVKEAWEEAKTALADTLTADAVSAVKDFAELFETLQTGDVGANVTAVRKALTSASGAVASMGSLFTTCGEALFPSGRNVVQIHRLASAFGDIGTIGSAVGCAVTAGQNAADVWTEVSCLADDWRNSSDQYAALQRGNQTLCENVASLAQNDAVTALTVKASDGANGLEPAQIETVKGICVKAVVGWGKCLDLSIGSSFRTEQSCEHLCKPYRNNQGVASEAAKAFERTGDAEKSRSFLSYAMLNCAAPSLSGDGVQGCINNCMGR